MTTAGFRLTAAQVARLGHPDGPKIWRHPNGEMSVTFPKLAMDAMPRRMSRRRLALDEMGPRGLSSVAAFLRERLSDEDFAALMEMVNGNTNGEDRGDPEPEDNDRDVLPDGTKRSSYVAQDEAHAALLKRYPNFDRLKRAL